MNIRDVSVVLLGHGSRYDENAEGCVVEHAQALDSRSIFRDVYAGFIRQNPDIVEVVERTNSKIVFVVPMLMSEGFIMEKAEQILKERFVIIANSGVKVKRVSTEKIVFLCKPIGTHDTMKEIIKKKAYEVMEKDGSGNTVLQNDVSLFIAAHGNSKDKRSRLVVEQHVKAIMREKIFQGVHGVYIEEEPTIRKVYEIAESECVVIVPFFASRGPHVTEDIPAMLGEDRKEIVRRLENRERSFRNPTFRMGKYIWLTEPVGCDLKVVDIVVRRVLEKLCENTV